MGFVGNYAPVDFHHRLTACPSYKKSPGLIPGPENSKIRTFSAEYNAESLH